MGIVPPTFITYNPVSLFLNNAGILWCNWGLFFDIYRFNWPKNNLPQGRSLLGDCCVSIECTLWLNKYVQHMIQGE